MTHHSDLNGYFNKLPKMNYKSYCAVTEFASQWFRWRNIASTLYICLAYFVCRSFSHREDSLETKWNFIAGSVYIHVNRWKIALSFVCFGCDIFDFDAIRYFVHSQNARRNEMRWFICGFWDRSFGFRSTKCQPTLIYARRVDRTTDRTVADDQPSNYDDCWIYLLILKNSKWLFLPFSLPAITIIHSTKQILLHFDGPQCASYKLNAFFHRNNNKHFKMQTKFNKR